MKSFFCLGILALSSLTFAAKIWSGAFTGVVLDNDGEVVKDARVLVVELKKQTRVDENGRFSFGDIPAGTYTLEIESDFFGSILRTVEVAEGQDNHATLTFDVAVHEDYTVTAAAERKSISDVALAVGVLGDQDLQKKMAPTLGETLAREPGVSSSYFGPGSSRPIIRGMGGDRIRILEGGLGTGDASSVSADHAISADTLTTERIEIVRGPASLRYGSSAVGGVVNIIDNRIPEFLTSTPIAGSVDLRADTASDERSGAVALNGSVQRMAWHVDFSSKETDDVEIPGEPTVHLDEDEDHHDEEGHEEEFTGVLENSALTNRKGAVGLSYIGKRGYLGFSYTDFDNEYGIPGEHAHEHAHEGEDEGEEEEAPVTIDMKQRRTEMRGGYNFEQSFLRSLDVRAALADYEHTELEGAEVGTRFFNDYQEFRVELLHGPLGALTSGSFGVQYTERDFEAIGAEAFVPPNVTEKLGLYAFEEWDRGQWSLSAGARYESQKNKGSILEHEHEDEDHEGEDHEEDGHEEPEPVNLSFDGFSGSLGYTYGKESPYGFYANITYTQRAPNAEELFSNGPHLATAAFEVGNPNLKKETSTGFEVQVRKKEGRVTGELNLFRNNFDDYIYEAFTGDEQDGLSEFIFLQEDAAFTGGEIHIDTNLIHEDPHHLHLELSYDLVRAELDSGANLPRIPPQRLTVGLEYRQPAFWASTEVQYNDQQNRIAPFETATDDYTFLNASMGYRFFWGAAIHQILLKGTNLTDEEGRVHTSFLKNQVLLPGRNISVSYKLTF